MRPDTAGGTSSRTTPACSANAGTSSRRTGLQDDHDEHAAEENSWRGLATLPAEAARLFAQEDLGDVMQCDVLISFTERHDSGYSRGGRHVEFGLAYALGKMLFVVGPRENVFHALEGVRQFSHMNDTVMDALDDIDDIDVTDPYEEVVVVASTTETFECTDCDYPRDRTGLA